jgi:hypothetical protein
VSNLDFLDPKDPEKKADAIIQANKSQTMTPGRQVLVVMYVPTTS